MGKSRHPEDHELYESLLEQTRDSDGVVHRDEAVKKLAEVLAEDASRAAEYANDRANNVADGFDQAHKPETDNGQMAFDIDTYLVIGVHERVRVDAARTRHTRLWLDVQTTNHARVSAAWAAKDMHGRRLLALQEEHDCTMWEAEQMLRGVA